MNLTDFLGNNDADWMAAPDRPCDNGPVPEFDPRAWGEEVDDSVYPPEKFYDAAKKNCDGCPVMLDCLKFALDNNEEHGIWGGTTPAERAQLMNGAVA